MRAVVLFLFYFVFWQIGSRGISLSVLELVFERPSAHPQALSYGLGVEIKTTLVPGVTVFPSEWAAAGFKDTLLRWKMKLGGGSRERGGSSGQKKIQGPFSKNEWPEETGQVTISACLPCCACRYAC